MIYIYLGLLIDEKLKWTDHIEHVYNKIIKYIGIFYKIRNKLPFDILITETIIFCLCSFPN